jgi:hypothetical protein
MEGTPSTRKSRWIGRFGKWVEGWKKKVGRANNELEKTYITQRNLTEPFFPLIFNVKRKNIYGF